MDHILKHLDFRAFSYESDPEYLVDMFRANEVLEGSWFDSEETCRMHQKIVTRASSSSWAMFFAKAIVGYADLLKATADSAVVGRWSIHPDFHHPGVVRKMVENLQREALKRGFHRLTVFADKPEAIGDFDSIGWQRDRMYQWAMLGDTAPTSDITATPVEAGKEMIDREYLAFLGSPYPPNFALARAFMAFDYGVFNFRRPEFVELHYQGNSYLACYDGREWFVFRTRRDPGDGEAIRPILDALGEIRYGRILLSEKTLEKAEIVPANEEILWDYFLEF